MDILPQELAPREGSVYFKMGRMHRRLNQLDEAVTVRACHWQAPAHCTTAHLLVAKPGLRWRHERVLAATSAPLGRYAHPNLQQSLRCCTGIHNGIGPEAVFSRRQHHQVRHREDPGTGHGRRGAVTACCCPWHRAISMKQYDSSGWLGNRVAWTACARRHQGLQQSDPVEGSSGL